MTHEEAVCPACDRSRRHLLRKTRPNYEHGAQGLRVADLFCGAGALSLGVADAARSVGFAISGLVAVDIDAAALQVYRRNFPSAVTMKASISDVFDGELRAKRTDAERTFARHAAIDMLIGGPPCQGHSDLNNHTRRSDPRNRLYARMARAAEVLSPKVILIENVPAVTKDHSGVVEECCEALQGRYDLVSFVVDAAGVGVPQRRKRHFLVGALKTLNLSLNKLLEVRSPCRTEHERSVGWAIGDLVDCPARSGFDRAASMSDDNVRRLQWLFDNDAYDLPNDLRPKCHRSDHSYKSMYGRMHWDAPAQTVTTGFSSMGQGRYVHPLRMRTLTPHEAARLQTFPDFFRFDAVDSRTAWATMIGNAVPPLLATAVALPLLRALRLQLFTERTEAASFANTLPFHASASGKR